MQLDGCSIRTITHPSGNQSVIVQKDRSGMLREPPAPVPRRGETTFYIPYTAVHPQTVQGAPADAIWVDVSASPISYYGAMLGWWEKGETFAVIEHDIVCRPDVIQQFEECPEPWCSFGYSDICHDSCMEAWANELGCTRFRAEIIKAVPDAVSSMSEERWDWHNMCDGLGGLDVNGRFLPETSLRAHGFTHHWHWPAVEHHHNADGIHGPQKPPMERAIPPKKETR